MLLLVYKIQKKVLVMAAGKALRAIGGILVLVSTFILAWMEFLGTYISGLSIVNFQQFIDAAEVSSEPMLIWLALIMLIGTVISGLMILIGIKVRFLAILFSLFPLVLGVLMILAFAADIQAIDEFNLAFGLLAAADPLVDGVIPYYLDISDGISLGQILLAASGLVGLIGGFMKTED